MELLQNLPLKLNSRILLRLDLNLPQDENGNFTDLFRLEASLPTLHFLQAKNCTIFIIAHLGSPKGQKVPNLSLKPLSVLLSQKLQQKVKFVADPFDSNLKLNQQSGIFLLENLRFSSGEEQNSAQFAKSLISATGSEYFVQDAFGVCHRAHASLVQLPKFLPSAAGLLLQKEVAGLSISNSSGLSLIVGGAKVESKLPVIKNFINSASSVLTGGVVANTLLKASGQDIAASLFSAEQLSLSSKLLASSTKIKLPLDYLVASSEQSTKARSASQQNLQSEDMILDLGPKTTSTFIQELHNAKNIVWAGTLGFAENPIFSHASTQIIDAILSLKNQNPKLKIIIGGGDTVDFIRANLSSAELAKIDHISTGGGASLQFLAGQQLPGIVALSLTSHSIQAPTSRPTPTSRPNPDPTPNLSLSLTSTFEPSSSPKHNLQIKTQLPILALNLKANFNLEQAKLWLQEALQIPELTQLKKVQFIIAAPAIFLEEFSSDIAKLNLSNRPQIFAEDISKLDSGAHTGEISAEMLQNIASGTLLGHSERRINFAETNQVIYQKAGQALKNNLNLILCIGSKSKNSTEHQQELYTQLSTILPLFNSANSNFLTIAYEPVFAIGSGDVPSPQFLAKQLSLIQLTLQDFGLQAPILYGGSVDQSNVQQFLTIGFNGVLVGSAALKIPTLKKIGQNISS